MSMQSLGAACWTEDETLRMLREYTPMPDSIGNVGVHGGNIAVKIMSQIAEDIPPSLNHEALAIQLVRQQTRIPVPRLYQAYSYHRQEGITYLIMDYVRGERLDHAWPKLSWCARARVAWTLRSYVRQLRRIKMEPSHFPGPLGPRPLLCQGYIWESDGGRESGPFADATAMVSRLEQCAFSPRDPNYCGFNRFGKPQPLVFAHNDLCLRNIILGEDGQVWVIDWGFAGFYPEFFEYTNMDMAAHCDPNKVPLSWKRCIPFIANLSWSKYLVDGLLLLRRVLSGKLACRALLCTHRVRLTHGPVCAHPLHLLARAFHHHELPHRLSALHVTWIEPEINYLATTLLSRAANCDSL